MTKLLVSYTLTTRPDASAMDSVVDLPNSVTPEEIPGFVRKTICPPANADPTDGFRGRSPSQVVILNLVTLASLRSGSDRA